MFELLFVQRLRHIGSLLLLTLFLGSGPATWAQTPIEIEVAKLLASDGSSNDYFGYSVAIDADTAVIGAYGDKNENGYGAGAAYVFSRGDTGWVEQAKLTASDGEFGDNFGGLTVALDGDTAVIGAFGDSDYGPFTGAAYVFKRNNSGTWIEEAKLVASDRAANDNFGRFVAVDGATALIGAYNDSNYNGDHAGAAYVFVHDGNNWSERDKLIASDGETGDYFGHSVALDGDTAVIGAFNRDSSAGAAYVFVRDSAGVWVQQAKLTASDRTAGDRFGQSVALDGDIAVIGAWSDYRYSGYGSAYVFVRDSAGTWIQQTKLTPSDSSAGYGNGFGLPVAINGDTAVIAAVSDNGDYAGAVYVFRRDSSGSWAEEARLVASDGAPEDYLGRGVALDGDTALIGAFGADYNGGNSGAAYVFSIGSYTFAGLIDRISSLPADALDQELINSLTQKLNNAEKQATKENICAAVNILGAFQNEVEAQAGNKIADDTATLLIEYSDNLITQLLEMLAEGEACPT